MKNLESLQTYIDTINLSSELNGFDDKIAPLDFDDLSKSDIQGLCEGIHKFCQDRDQEFNDPDLYASRVEFLLEVVEDLKEYALAKVF